MPQFGHMSGWRFCVALLGLLCCLGVAHGQQPVHARFSKRYVDSLYARLGSNDTTHARAALELGCYYYYDGVARTTANDSMALHYLLESLTIYERLNNAYGRADALQSLADYFFHRENMYQAVNFMMRALEAAPGVFSQKHIGLMHIHLGSALYHATRYTEAIERARLGISLISSDSSKRYFQAGGYMLIGNCLDRMGQYVPAREQFMTALEMYKKMGDRAGVSYAYVNLGELEMDLKQWLNALVFLEQGYELARERENKGLMTDALSNLAEVHCALGNPVRGLALGEQSLEVAKAEARVSDIVDAHHAIFVCHRTLMQTEKALESFQHYITYRDSLKTINASLQIAQLQSDLDIQRKQTEIRLLQEQGNNERFLYVSLLVGLSALILIGFLVFRLRVRSQAAKQLAVISQAAPFPLTVIRARDKVILELNQAAMASSGFSYQESIGHNIYDFVDDPVVRSQLESSATAGLIMNVEIPFLTKHRGRRWYIVNTTEIRFQDEDAVLVGCIDITERRNAEQAQQKLTQELQLTLSELQEARHQLLLSEKLTLLGQLTAGIAHEMNTPLSAAKSSVESLLQSVPNVLHTLSNVMHRLEDADAHALLDIVMQAGQVQHSMTTREERRMRGELGVQIAQQGLTDADELAAQLVRLGLHTYTPNLIDLISRYPGVQVQDCVMQLGQWQTSLRNIQLATQKAANVVRALKSYTHTRQGASEGVQPVPLVENINTILSLYAYEIRHKAELITRFDSNPVVLGNADKLGQIWTNLLSNALQAITPGGRIEVTVLQQQGYAITTFTDNGKGIPVDILARIFDPFFTTKDKGEGTGMGLSIVRQIVEGYGGHISVESMPNITTFTVRLPVAQNEMPQLVAEAYSK